MHALQLVCKALINCRPHNQLPCPAFVHTRRWRYAHGACWAELCEDLEVIDVPGDHFSLLRQSPADMDVMVATLKMCLGAFGWAEAVRRERREWRLGSNEVEALDEYLARMGVG